MNKNAHHFADIYKCILVKEKILHFGFNFVPKVAASAASLKQWRINSLIHRQVSIRFNSYHLCISHGNLVKKTLLHQGILPRPTSNIPPQELPKVVGFDWNVDIKFTYANWELEAGSCIWFDIESWVCFQTECYNLNKLFHFQTQWADADHVLGQFIYISYNETDFDSFGKQYNYNGHSAGYVKKHLTHFANPASLSWNATLHKMYQNTSKYELYKIIYIFWPPPPPPPPPPPTHTHTHTHTLIIYNCVHNWIKIRNGQIDQHIPVCSERCCIWSINRSHFICRTLIH